MSFLTKLIPEKFRKEKDPRPILTLEETWEFIYWSFFYSRGKMTIQEILFEVIARNYQLPKKFNPSKVPQDVIKKTADFRNGNRHKQTRDAFEEKTEADMLLTSKLELERIAGVLRRSELKRGRFKRHSDSDLLSGLGKALLQTDYLYSEFKGNKISHLKHFFLQHSTIPGGSAINDIKTALAPLWGKLFSSDEKVDEAFRVFNVVERNTDNPLLNISCKEMWEKIQEKLHSLEIKKTADESK